MFWQKIVAGSLWIHLHGIYYLRNTAVTLSPEDFLLAENIGVCLSLQAIEEFRDRIRDPVSGRMLDAHVARCREGYLGRSWSNKKLLGSSERKTAFTFDAPNVPPATDYIVVSR